MPVRYPDNTIEGFRAVARTVGLAELDVRRSRDGRRVLAHDPTLNSVDVAGTTWADLSQVELVDRFGTGGYRPTTLEAVMEELPELGLDIEIKNTPGDPAFDPTFAFALDVAAVARPIDVVSCFFWPTMDAVKQELPSIGTGLLLDASGSLEDALAHALDHGHEMIAPHWSLLVEQASLDFILDTGVALATWTVNDEKVAVGLSKAGVGTIISDDPVRISEALRRHHQETE